MKFEWCAIIFIINWIVYIIKLILKINLEKMAIMKFLKIMEDWKKQVACLSLNLKKAVNNFFNNIFIEKIIKFPNNLRYYKTGALSEWYNFETTKPNNLETIESKNRIRLKIINTACEETDMELEKTEQIRNVIKLYCDKKGIPYTEGLYLTKIDLKKIDANLTINEINIPNNHILYLFDEDFEKK